MTRESPVSPGAITQHTEVAMVWIGVDAHKRVHVAVALNEAGRQLGHWKGPNSPDGWQQLYEWATSLGGSRVWGVEGAWSYGRGLAQHLVAADESVHDVNSRWTALGRRSARKRGKNDRLDASSVAACVRQEGTSLPRVGAEDETTLLDLLMKEREAALAEVMRLRNQVHALLMQIDSEYALSLRNRRGKTRFKALESYEAPAGSKALQLSLRSRGVLAVGWADGRLPDLPPARQYARWFRSPRPSALRLPALSSGLHPRLQRRLLGLPLAAGGHRHRGPLVPELPALRPAGHRTPR